MSNLNYATYKYSCILEYLQDLRANQSRFLGLNKPTLVKVHTGIKQVSSSHGLRSK